MLREHEGQEPRGGSVQWKLPSREARQGCRVQSSPDTFVPQSCPSSPHPPFPGCTLLVQ